jgi:CRP-like cAMP-binding protein
MNSAIMLAHINQVVPLDREETAFLESVLIPRPFKQGELIVKSGEPARYMMYVNSGYLMTYFTDKNGTDHVIQFASDGWWVGDIYSLSKEAHTRYTTKGLCDGEVLLLPRLAQNQLLERYIKFERYFRITFQNSVLRHQLRFIESHSNSAEERYQSFITTYPNIQQYVPQKYIASYLGITAEFLSKVRRKLAKRS